MRNLTCISPVRHVDQMQSMKIEDSPDESSWLILTVLFFGQIPERFELQLAFFVLDQ